ncbi:hypothetical protein, partial [Azospirillum doebereinerae]
MPSTPPAGRGRIVVNVEVDDRTVLFPDGKFLSHILIHEETEGGLRLEAAFHFNESRLDPRLCTLGVEDARDLARAILDAVFQGRTQHMLSATARIAVVFNPNGFLMRFGEHQPKELFIASPAIVRLAQGVLR